MLEWIPVARDKSESPPGSHTGSHTEADHMAGHSWAAAAHKVVHSWGSAGCMAHIHSRTHRESTEADLVAAHNCSGMAVHWVGLGVLG